MTLQDKLDAQRARSAVNPVWLATYEATVAELRRSARSMPARAMEER